MGGIVSVAMMVASLAALSRKSLSGIEEWPGIHWIKIEDEMDGIVDGERSRIWWDEGFTQGLTVCAKEYGDWTMVGIGECPR